MKKSLLVGILALSLNASTALAAIQPEFTSGAVGISKATIKKSVAYFVYSPETQYEINAQPGYITDLQFHASEGITNIESGDTQRWMIDTSTVDGIPHVYIKPVADGVSTNLIVNTTEKTYRLVVHSNVNYVPVVAWTYPEDVAAEKNKESSPAAATDPALLAIHFNYNYSVKAKKKSWIPSTIYDDGTRTFIKIPVDTKNDLPVIHILDDKTPALVNYRVQDGWFIVDRVFNKAILNFTAEQSITIQNLKGEDKK